MRKHKTRKIARGAWLAFLGILLVAAIAIGGSAAWFTGRDEVKNTFTMGKIELQLTEPNWENTHGLDLKPGAVRPKDPTVSAVAGRGYMRVKLEIVDSTEALITDEARIALILQTLFYNKDAAISQDEAYSLAALEALQKQGNIDYEYNRAAFAYAGHESGKPGVRYYNYIANNGIFDAARNDSIVLFTHVVIAKDWQDEDFELLSGTGGYKLRLTAQAMQADEMADAAAAFAALNKATGVTVEVAA